MTTSCMVQREVLMVPIRGTGQGRGAWRTVARASAAADRRVTELTPAVLAESVAEPRPPGQTCHDARLADRTRRRPGRALLWNRAGPFRGPACGHCGRRSD